MERKEIFERIRNVVADSAVSKVDLDTVTEATPIADLGFDSLAVLDLLFDLEQEFGVQITAAQIQEIATVGELVTFLKTRLEGGGSEGGGADGSDAG
ncbi:MAG: acyl carrier protein [Planctomycetota bacterium]